jgi:hypothetical protein
MPTQEEIQTTIKTLKEYRNSICQVLDDWDILDKAIDIIDKINHETGVD